MPRSPEHRTHLAGAGGGADPYPDPRLPLSVAPLAALPRVPRAVPAPGLHLPAVPLPRRRRRYPPPVGARLHVPPARGQALPPAVVVAVPVPLPAPTADRALRRHRAGAGAVGRGGAPGLRAPSAGAQGSHEVAAAALRAGGCAHHRSQRRHRRGGHPRAVLGPA
uniref:Uncharacterized protein n=1 Tax=Leersia perrieri TaxID=77586 RepID=A0A0D9W674_9ORYZ